MSAPNKKGPEPDEDCVWVYARRIRNWRTGKYVYPKKGKFFRFKVPRKTR